MEEAEPHTDEERAKINARGSSSLRDLVEHDLESAGAGNVVELVRNVVGPEPLREQPPAIRLFAWLFLGVPLFFIVVIEWQFRRLIPFWISMPLTVIGLISYLWRYFRRTGMDKPKAQRRQVASAESVTAGEQDARTFARLLITEIKLYNSGLVAQGVRDGSLYQLLKKEIDRARSSYESRVAPAIRERHDYFQEELIRILADGNPDRLKR